MRWFVARVDEVRRLEGELIDGWHYPQLQLMERAALGVAWQVRQLADRSTPLVVMAGRGNNGGDAVAAARILQDWGFRPTVHVLPGEPTPALAIQLGWAREWGVPLHPWERGLRLPDGAVVIDGIFGFGLNRAPADEAVEAIDTINLARTRAVVAVDLPSGLDGTTGTAPGEVVQASHTVAAGLLKAGVVSDPALDCVGELSLADIGFPTPLLEGLRGEVIVPKPLPRRSLAAHKGEAGAILVIGGSRSMSGAPAMVAQAAGRMGAGLVYVAVPAEIREAVANQMPEAVVVPVPGDAEGGMAAGAWEYLVPLMERSRAVVIGPGMGPGAGARAIARRLWAQYPRGAVFDADALHPEIVCQPAGGPRVVTPHPGEAGRLVARHPDDVQAHRLEVALAVAERCGGLAVLKGARSVVAESDGFYAINLLGHPAMATAGSGDVLAGMIGGLWVQGLAPREAARQGVAIHGLCGERAAHQGPRRNILALDMVHQIGEVTAALEAPRALRGAPLMQVGAYLRGGEA